MRNVRKIAQMIAASAFAALPLLSQTAAPKPSFEVVSIKPSSPGLGIRGGGPRGDRFSMVGASLKMLVQIAYQPLGSNGQPIGGQIQVSGGPSWIDSERYDIEAKADCSGGVISRKQLQLMVRAMMEDRFQLKAHLETRELPVYNLVVGKDGPKLKASADQTPPAIGGGGPPQPCGPAGPPPVLPPPPGPGRGGGPPDISSRARGAMFMAFGPTGLTMQANSAPVANLVNLLQQFVGRPVMDKTDIKGLYDLKLVFSPEGLTLPGAPGGPGPGGPGFGPGGPGGAVPPAGAADPVPSLFTAIQDLGLRLESSKGLVEVVVIDGAQKPTEN
jgi:uncharacterized protein (TIGR03435 family)